MTREEIMYEIKSLKAERDELQRSYYETKKGCNHAGSVEGVLSCWREAELYWDEARKVDITIAKLQNELNQM